MEAKAYNSPDFYSTLEERCRAMAGPVFGATAWKYSYEPCIWSQGFSLTNVGTGTSAFSGTGVDLTTGANAASSSTLRSSFITSNFKDAYIASKPFFFGVRMNMDTTPDAQAQAWFGTFNDRMQVGVIGSVSTTKFSAFFNSGAAPTLVSTVSIDTSWHEVFCWKDREGTTYLSVDNEIPIISATATPSAADILCVKVANGTTAAEQSVKFEQIFAAYGMEGT